MEETQSSQPNTARQIKRITWIGIVINVALAALKFIVGTLGRSQAVMADAVHSLSDLGTDLAILLGVKYWTAPADDNHPYGHRRIESLITAFIGVLLGGAALQIGFDALRSIREPHLSSPGWIALIGPLLSIFLKEGVFRWTISVGKRTRSKAVMANAWHHRSDAISSLPAFFAVLGSAWNPSLAFLDHVGAIIVSVFILRVAWNILIPALNELSDQGATEKEVQQIKKLVQKTPGVTSAHKLRTRRVGYGFFVDLHIQVPGDMPVYEGHAISETVTARLIEQGPNVLDVCVHIEPDT
ncbi:cation transporter [candidate division KSB1 bacterium]|nr:cation transporter [candidate division KSB1 bacterium]